MLKITPSDTPEETTEWLDELLNVQSEEAVGLRFVADMLTLEAWDGDTRLGGITARFGTHWVFIDLLALTPDVKRNGTGRKLMQAVEAEAKARGKTGIWLDTYSFQAPGFYRRLGYKEVGRIPNYPRDQTRHFFAKRLDGGQLDGFNEDTK